MARHLTCMILQSITKSMVTLSSIFSGLEFGSRNHTLIEKVSELKVFKNMKLLGEISSN